MKKSNRLKIILALLVLAILIASVSIYYVFKKAPDSVKSEKAQLETDATQLAVDFNTDETNANTKYLGKVIKVSGIIDSFTEDKAQNKISVTLKDKGSETGVICEFTTGNIDTQTLQKGNKILIKGICNGFLFDVVLTKCIVDN